MVFLAIIQAPFFVHLEMLFDMGYYTDTHKKIQAAIDAEKAKVKKTKSAKSAKRG